MKLFCIPAGTKVCLGNGDGNLQVVTTNVDISYSSVVSDPIYYYNHRNNINVMKTLNQDPTIKAQPHKVAKFEVASNNNAGFSTNYNYVYVNVEDVKTF